MIQNLFLMSGIRIKYNIILSYQMNVIISVFLRRFGVLNKSITPYCLLFSELSTSLCEKNLSP